VGSETVVGNSGTLTNIIDQNGGAGSMIFAGAGSTNLILASGVTTLLGNAGGTVAATLAGGGLVDIAYGQTSITADEYTGYGPGGGAMTILGVGGALTVNGGYGLFLGAPGGNNHITIVGGTVFAGGAGDVLTATNQQGGDVTFVAAAGAETINAAGSRNTVLVYGGSGPELIKASDVSTTVQVGTGATTFVGGNAGLALLQFVAGNATTVEIQNFQPSIDYLQLAGFAPGEAATALAGATTSAGSEHLTLSDGTHITLAGFTGLTASSFI
jgi:hypothetical protein